MDEVALAAAQLDVGRSRLGVRLCEMAPLIYSEQRPLAALTPWVSCFWQITGAVAGGSPVSHRVLPDGCADLLFNLEVARRNGGRPGSVVGPMSSAHVVGFQGSIDLLGVRLRPGALRAFSGVRADELLDTAASITDAKLTLRVSIAELADAPTFSARTLLLSEACRRRVASLISPDASVRHALGEWARTERAFPKISVLTRDLGLSERAFERRFLAEVGLTPVRYRRLARFRSVLRLHAGGLRDWAELAATTGFSDQSHLVRDCRAFAGLTPTEWAATQASPAGFLQDGHITAL
jgi:AraC-like DNA-binding protein